MKKSIVTAILNIVCPLFIGLSVYILFYENTYLNLFFHINLHLTLNGFAGAFVKSWLCDILWSYSLLNAIYISMFALKKRLLIACVFSVGLIVSLEMLQYFNFISGTFDILDIFFEITAAFFAVYIIKKGENKK